MIKIKVGIDSVKDKFIIRNENGNRVTETTAKDRELAFIRYPAVFNTEEDAIKYLNIRKIPDSVMSHFKIESSNLFTFPTGAILIDFDEESDTDKFATVRNVLSRLQKEDQSKLFSIEFLINGMNEFRMSYTVRSIFINQEDKKIQLTNERFVGNDNYLTIKEIYNTIKDYPHYKINLRIYDHTSRKVIDEDLDKNFIIVGGTEPKLITCLKSDLKRFITD